MLKLFSLLLLTACSFTTDQSKKMPSIGKLADVGKCQPIGHYSSLKTAKDSEATNVIVVGNEYSGQYSGYENLIGYNCR
jgi:hypothetical protein